MNTTVQKTFWSIGVSVFLLLFALVPSTASAIECSSYPDNSLIEATAIESTTASLNGAQTTLTITTNYTPEQYCDSGNQWMWYWKAQHTVQSTSASPQVTSSTAVDTGTVQSGAPKTYQTSVDVSALGNGSYTVTHAALGNLGAHDSDSSTFTITNRSVAPTVSLSANPTGITSGGSSTLSWSTSGSPTSCTASGGWSGAKNVNGGNQAVSPSGNTTYTITCSNSAGSDSDSASVTVSGGTAPTVTLTADPTSITEGGSSTLTWTTSGSPTSCTASGGWSGGKSVSGGNEGVSPTDNTTYTIECTNASGSSSDSATIVVEDSDPPQNPTGTHETASNSTCTVSGWANDPDTPTTPPSIAVYADNVEITTGTASTCASGQCPFSFTLSGLITPDTAHSILIKAADTSTGQRFNLSQSPKTLTCSSGGSSIDVDLTARTAGSGTYQDSLSVASGSDIDLRWTTSGSPTSCTASGSWSGAKSVSGGTEQQSNITSSKTYTIECTNGSSITNDTVVVSITGAPYVYLQGRESVGNPWSEGPITVNSGDSADLQWAVSGASFCTKTATPSDSQWGGNTTPTNGAGTLTNRTESKYYKLQCSGSGGTTNSNSVLINVQESLGTVAVRSIDIDTGASVITNWSITGPQQENGDNSANETYPNMPSGLYTLVPGTDPVGYDLVNVQVGGGDTSSQTLSAGGAITFTIRYQEDSGDGGSESISCNPLNQAADTGETVSVHASGGNGLYYWTTDGDARPSEEGNGNFNSFITYYTTAGDKVVVVSDGSASAQCTVEVDQAAQAECSNGIDDDEDGYTDYPYDLDCSGLNDTSELGTVSNYTLDSGGLIIMGAGDTRSGATQITARVQGGFSVDIDFAPSDVSGLPGGVNAFFSDGAGSPNQKSDLTLDSSEYSTGVQFYVESDSPLSIGEYPLTITSRADTGLRGGEIVRTEDVLLRVLTAGSGSGATTTPDIEEF